MNYIRDQVGWGRVFFYDFALDSAKQRRTSSRCTFFTIQQNHQTRTERALFMSHNLFLCFLLTLNRADLNSDLEWMRMNAILSCLGRNDPALHNPAVHPFPSPEYISQNLQKFTGKVLMNFGADSNRISSHRDCEIAGHIPEHIVQWWVIAVYTVNIGHILLLLAHILFIFIDAFHFTALECEPNLAFYKLSKNYLTLRPSEESQNFVRLTRDGQTVPYSADFRFPYSVYAESSRNEKWN